jgi:ADP-ribose pyrophosphatase
VKEIIVNKQTIYNGRVVGLALLDVTLPNGEAGKRELIQHPGAVAVVAIDEQGNVLLVKQYRIAADKIMREIPAGTLKPGEDPLVCAERELQEETGYKPGRLEPIGGIYPAPGYTTEYIHLFLATDLQHAPLPMDDDEFIEVERLPLAEALALVDSNEICDAKSVAGLLRVARRQG